MAEDNGKVVIIRFNEDDNISNEDILKTEHAEKIVDTLFEKFNNDIEENEKEIMDTIATKVADKFYTKIEFEIERKILDAIREEFNIRWLNRDTGVAGIDKISAHHRVEEMITKAITDTILENKIVDQIINYVTTDNNLLIKMISSAFNQAIIDVVTTGLKNKYDSLNSISQNEAREMITSEIYFKLDQNGIHVNRY